MSSENEKMNLLKKAEYRYHFDRDLYFNKRDKVVFSIEYIEDNDKNTLSENIKNKSSKNDWIFFTNEPISEEIKEQIKREINEK